MLQIHKNQTVTTVLSFFLTIKPKTTKTAKHNMLISNILYYVHFPKK